jgi:mono/diheme cytochrome c family protein
MKILFTLLAFVFLISCSKNAKKNVLSTNNLPTQLLNIDITKDTIITTTNGAILTIPKGTLISDSSNVQLELKEAFTIAQIIEGGLTTVTNGKLLSSGGMFYLNPVGNNKVSIAKPIAIKVPSDKVNGSMKIYKGNEKGGQLNWDKPVPFKVKSLVDTFENFKALFINNCASCHAIGKDATGPDLAYMGRLRTKNYLRTFTRNWEEAVENGYCQAIKIQNWSNSQMNKFPSLTDNDNDKLYAYIDFASEQNGLPFVDDGVKARQDSCEKYGKEKEKLYKLNQQKETINRISDSIYVENYNKTKVEPSYYELEITNFGWHNIDILTQDLPNVIKTKINLKITGENNEKLQVYLVVPTEKILALSSYKNNSFTFDYSNVDGSFYLPKAVTAYIIAVGESDGKFYYSKKEFIVSENVSVELRVELASNYAFNADMRRMGWDGLDIKAKSIQNKMEDKNSTIEEKQNPKIELLNKEIEKINNLKPKQGCDCESKIIDTSSKWYG